MARILFDIKKQQINNFNFDFFVNFLMQLNNALYLLPQIAPHIINLAPCTALISIIYDPTQSPIPHAPFRGEFLHLCVVIAMQ